MRIKENPNTVDQHQQYFDSDLAFAHVEYQLAHGARVPGSSGHIRVRNWLSEQLTKEGWIHETQYGEVMGHPIFNVIGKKGFGKNWLIIGTHYDSRIYSDRDPNPINRQLPVPGANDGASGVAVLIELARVIPDDIPMEVWLVFFDGEDNGNIPGWDWILGSNYFVNQLENYPDAMILLDMVGDKKLKIHMEKNSDLALTNSIWKKAQTLGYGDYFIPKPKYSILDDHIPFIQVGVPSVDIIDIDYPFYHTTEDTLDKISAASLQIVGDTILAWLMDYK